MPDLRRLWRWRPRRVLVAEALAEPRGGGSDPIARPNVAYVGVDGVQATRNERQERGWVGIEGRDLGVVRRCDEEAEATGEREDNYHDETNALHAGALPCHAARRLRRGRR